MFQLLAFSLFHHYFSDFVHKYFNTDTAGSWAYSCISSIIMLFGYGMIGLDCEPFVPLSGSQEALLNFNAGYFVADAIRIWRFSWEESQLYFYHHIPPVVYTLVFPRFGFHFVMLFFAEANLPIFNLDMGMRACLGKRRTLLHRVLGAINLVAYFLCRIIGIGGYAFYVVYYYGFWQEVGVGWYLTILGICGFWFMFVQWFFKMYRSYCNDLLL
jgi:hypothetical protein